MKHIIFISILLSLMLSGCAKSYNLMPSYNKDTQIVKIGSYSIENISYYKEKKLNPNINSMGNTGYTIKSIRSDGGICDAIEIVDYESNNNWFYYNSAKEDLLKQYKDNCEIEKVEDNLNFLICDNKYFMTNSQRKHSGYGAKITAVMDKHCFQDMKNHFKSITQPSNTITTTKKQDISIYSGTFVSTKASKCASIGKVNIYINNDVIGGNITYNLNNKEYISEITGSVIGTKLAGKTENLQFIGTVKSNSIDGKYYNDKCEGIFNVKLK